MKVIIPIIVFSITAYLSKSRIGASNTDTKNAKQLSHQVALTQKIKCFQAKDSLKYLIPDFFEIDSSQFEKFKSGRFANWFVSNDAKSRLYFVPYTDYSITTAVGCSISFLWHFVSVDKCEKLILSKDQFYIKC